jgi:hypothetical protein
MNKSKSKIELVRRWRRGEGAEWMGEGEVGEQRYGGTKSQRWRKMKEKNKIDVYFLWKKNFFF